MHHAPNFSQEEPQVSHGLNLTLELQDPAQMPALLGEIQNNMDAIRAALRNLHYVHYARFLPVRGNAMLMVVTEFDGPVHSYVLDFAVVIGKVFDKILGYMRDHPPLPIKDHPEEFIAFVEKNNRVVVHPPELAWDDYPVFSAYPERTVIDIVGRRREPLPWTDATPPDVPIPRADVQGNILRGYRGQRACHYALEVGKPDAMGEFLHKALDARQREFPWVTFDEDLTDAPPCRMNIGVTAAGLRAMGVPPDELGTFPAAFLQGPADPRRSALNGDTGPNAPEYWELGAPGDPVHFLVSLYGDAAEDKAKNFDPCAQQLEQWWKAHGIRVVASFEAAALPNNKVHFGYVDSIGQPRIAGAEGKERPDKQPAASVGQFLLGKHYQSAYGGSSLRGMPSDLCENASFAAVRILEQDVQAFDAMLGTAVATDGTKLAPDLVAAKLMGRWRDSGLPLSMEGQTVPPERLNDFDYGPTVPNADVIDDSDGLKCPVGAHMRRMNPRSSLVRGVPYTRRLIRRGMPYGPEWDPKAKGPDRLKRGIFGMFLCADIERQYEFILQEWANGDSAASGIRGTRDPIIGSQSAGGEFMFPHDGGKVKIKLPRLVSTRGSVYLLLPGRRGLEFLAGRTASRDFVPREFDPRTFDPRSPEFLRNPYDFYARFRDTAPVALVSSGGYKSYWVFSHALVTQVCEDEKVFLKRRVDRQGGAAPPHEGLFYMDNPRHDQVRPRLESDLQNAMKEVLPDALSIEVKAALDEVSAEGDGCDLVASYTHRVARNVFMRVFGIPADDWSTVDALMTTLLIHSDRMLALEHQLPVAAAAKKVVELFAGYGSKCPGSSGGGLLCALGRGGLLNKEELAATLLNFALGGYLSTDFLLASSVHNLLSCEAALARYRGLTGKARDMAFEELKRFSPPLPMADRYASEEKKLGDCVIPADAMVTVIYGSANHDAAVFGSDSDILKLDRAIDADTNFMFGHGIHYCIGAAMASMVAPRALDALVDAFPDLRLSRRVPIRYQDPYFRGFSRLPVDTSPP